MPPREVHTSVRVVNPRLPNMVVKPVKASKDMVNSLREVLEKGAVCVLCDNHVSYQWCKACSFYITVDHTPACPGNEDKYHVGHDIQSITEYLDELAAS